MRKPSTFFCLFCFTVLFPCTPGSAQESQSIRNFEEEVWYFDKEQARFVPHFESEKPDPRLLGFFISLKAAGESYLRVCSPHGTAIWVENKLFVGEVPAECYENSLASWRKEFGKDSVFVTLHSSQHIIDKTTIFLVSSQYSAATSGGIAPLSRSSNVRGQFLVLFTFLFLAIISVYRQQFPRAFRAFLDLGRMLSIRGRDDLVAGFRLLTTPSIVSHLLVSLLSGFFLCLFYFKEEIVQPLNSPSLPQYFERWLIFSLITLGFLLAKRFLIQFFGGIFKISGATYLQVFEYLRGGFLLLSIGFCLFLPLFYLNYEVSAWLLNKMPVFAGVFTFIIIILLFYKLAFETRYQKLHLFSYLCATETLPAILLLKWVFF